MLLHLGGDFMEMSHEIFIPSGERIDRKDAVILNVDEGQDLVHFHGGFNELLEIWIIKQSLLLKLELLVLKLTSRNQ